MKALSRSLLIGILGLSIVSFYGCNKTADNKNTENQSSDKENKKAEKIQKIIHDLNSWNKDELDAYERPEKHPNRLESGETASWVEYCKAELKKHGVTVKWDSDKQKYERVK